MPSAPLQDGLPPSLLTLRPTRMAAYLALGYAGLATLYILVSSLAAAGRADSVEALARIELWKGVGFVVVTSLGLFVLGRRVLRDVAEKGRILAEQNAALLRSERAATAGMLAASLAHDINNVLTSLHMALPFLDTQGAADDDASFVADLEASLHRVSTLSRRLLAVAGAEAEEVWTHDLRDAAREGASMAAIHVGVKRCEVTVQLPPEPVPVRGPERLLARAVFNLLVNAAEATGPGGRMLLSVRRDGAEAYLEVVDDGPGVAPEDADRIFTPFYTTKAMGTGMGLLSVGICAQEYGGSVELCPSPLGGAGFRLVIPTLDQSSSQA